MNEKIKMFEPTCVRLFVAYFYQSRYESPRENEIKLSSQIAWHKYTEKGCAIHHSIIEKACLSN